MQQATPPPFKPERPAAEKAAERDFQRGFQRDVRNEGIHRAVDKMHERNRALDESKRRDAMNRFDGIVSNRTLGGLKGGGYRPCKTAGKYITTRDTVVDGVKGMLTLEFYDGELVREEFKPF